MKQIDIVVPIYKGTRYIEGMVRQIRKCAGEVKGIAQVCLILVNDDPEETLDDYSTLEDTINILTVETDKNRGIHGARAHGLSYCNGEYVVFLDQDDRIYPYYLKSQLEISEGADAVVCRGINGGRLFYNEDRVFEECVSFNYMVSTGNGILSPGQVLICREAVPRFWQEHILQCSGADDWMLWLCMMTEGKKFVQNQEVLYEHVIGSSNCSGNTSDMHRSEQEMYEILQNHECYFKKTYLDWLKRALCSGYENRLKELDRLKTETSIYDMWLTVRQKERSIAAFLRSAGYCEVAIYGMGRIGQRLYQEIKEEVNVCYFIDRNAAYLNADIPVYALKEALPRVDLVMIALPDKGGRILEEVTAQLPCSIMGLEELLRRLCLEEG